MQKVEEREGGRVSVEEGQVGEVEAPPASDRQVDVDQVVAARQQADEASYEEDETLGTSSVFIFLDDKKYSKSVVGDPNTLNQVCIGIWSQGYVIHFFMV